MEETKVLHKKKVLAPKLRFKEFNEGWKSSNYKELTSMVTNGFVGVAKEHYVTSDGITYIQGYNIIEGGFNLHGIKQVSREFDLKNKKSKLQLEDLLTIQTGDIGVTSVVTENLVGANCHALVISRFNKNIAAPKFYMFYFNSERGRRMLKVIETGSTMKHLNVGDIIKLQVPFPSLDEQQKIASFLSAVDEKIQLLTRKKQLLEQYKKGVMQQLFSGKLRFKDENGKAYPKWDNKKLGQVGEIVSGLTYSPNDIHKDGVLVLRSSNVQDRRLSFEGNVYVNVSEGNFNPVKENDILICVRNGSKNLIGKNAIIDKKIAGVAFGAFMTVFRSDYNLFLFHYFDTDMYKNEVHKNLGATINSINGSDLKKFKIPFPSEPEQKKIADFLSAIDVKIESLSNQISQTQNFKKGLLQQMFV